MDVRCERCTTEYEFDDALVSARGTTVKCTTCGHKFKIRLAGGDAVEDGWSVQTTDGRSLVFPTLRALQRAIQTRVIDRADLLSRGALIRKPIGTIAELQPFFESSVVSEGTTGSSLSPLRRGVTAPGVGPPPRSRMTTRSDYPPAPKPSPAPIGSMKRTLDGTGPEATPAGPRTEPPGVERRRPSSHPPSFERKTGRFAVENPPRVAPIHAGTPTRSSVPPVRPSVAPTADGPSTNAPRATPTPPPVRVSVEGSSGLPASLSPSGPLAPPPAPPPVRVVAGEEADRSVGARSLPDGPASMGHRRSVGGFLVAAAVVAGVGILGAVWARNHFAGAAAKTPGPGAAVDSKAKAFVTAGERALAEGNLDAAKENFDKASALAEKDPVVLRHVAVLAAVRADVPWLKSRLLAADAVDEARSAKDDLAESSALARRAADDALAVAPDDPAALRAKLDALRIGGDRKGARALAGRIGASSAPLDAYVLAALELAEDEPLWPLVLDRLRIASSAESGPGRARAALVYALARSGDVTNARAELQRLSSMPRQHSLLPLLRSFVARARPTMSVEALPDGTRTTLPGHVRGKPEGREHLERALPAEAWRLVQQGEAARAKGDYDRAEMLFTAALDRHPNDTEALSGLAAIAHSRRDLSGARASYKRVLSSNPNYVPALVGLADVEFESGDRAAASKTYQQVVERFPEGQYPARVRQRLEPSGSGTAATASSAEATPPPATSGETE